MLHRINLLLNIAKEQKQDENKILFANEYPNAHSPNDCTGRG